MKEVILDMSEATKHQFPHIETQLVDFGVAPRLASSKRVPSERLRFHCFSQAQPRLDQDLVVL